MFSCLLIIDINHTFSPTKAYLQVQASNVQPWHFVACMGSVTHPPWKVNNLCLTYLFHQTNCISDTHMTCVLPCSALLQHQGSNGNKRVMSWKPDHNLHMHVIWKKGCLSNEVGFLVMYVAELAKFHCFIVSFCQYQC